MLQAGRYLNYARPATETSLSVPRLLAESCLKTAQKPCAVKRTRTALKSILIFRNELHHQNARNASESTIDANNAKLERMTGCISAEL